MCMIQDEYICFCSKAGVQAETLYVEMDSIGKGIVELISQHKIGRLVMGAAADIRYSRQATEHSHPNDPNENEVELTNSNTRLTRSTSKWSTPRSNEETEESFDDFDATSTFSLSMSLRFSLFSSDVTDTPLDPFPINDERTVITA